MHSDETTETPMDVSIIEGEMEICGIKTKGFRFFAILIVILLGLEVTILVAIVFNRGMDLALIWKDLALLGLGIFTGQKMRK